MQGYRIKDLDSTTRQLIATNKLDKNNDGLINKDNGELAELLSQTGVSDIQQLGRKDNRLKNLLMFECVAGGTVGGAALLCELADNKANTKASIDAAKLREQQRLAEAKRIDDIVDDLAKKGNIKEEGWKKEIRKLVCWGEKNDLQIKNVSQKYGGLTWQTEPLVRETKIPTSRVVQEVSETLSTQTSNNIAGVTKGKGFKSILKKMLNFGKNGKFMRGLKGAPAAVALLFGLLVNPFTMVPTCVATALLINPNARHKVGMDNSDAMAEPTVQPQAIDVEPKPVKEISEQEEIKTKFEETFKELGVSEDTELKEYVPQKGEYWISILKAKYGVNEEVAQKMANKIKEMVYDDAKAAKQTPIMYLPETWTFEGKTYNYNANAIPARTSDYSDNVKTEQGKMTKDLKY